MEWFIIFLALGVAIGPILYLMPSDRDRYITGLRAVASRQGYTVQLDKVLKLDPSDEERVTAGGGVRYPMVSCARYQLPLGVTLNNLLPLTLLRIPPQPSVSIERLLGDWGIALVDPAQQKALAHWRANPSAASETLTVLQQLPLDVLAVQLDKRFVAAFWLEKNPSAQNSKAQPLALFWPNKKPKAPATLAELPRLKTLDDAMKALLNVVKKHWGVSHG